jgi:hypothetical protein
METFTAPSTSSWTSLARNDFQMSNENEVSSPLSSASSFVTAKVRRPVEYAKT